MVVAVVKVSIYEGNTGWKIETKATTLKITSSKTSTQIKFLYSITLRPLLHLLFTSFDFFVLPFSAPFRSIAKFINYIFLVLSLILSLPSSTFRSNTILRYLLKVLCNRLFDTLLQFRLCYIACETQRHNIQPQRETEDEWEFRCQFALCKRQYFNKRYFSTDFELDSFCVRLHLTITQTLLCFCYHWPFRHHKDHLHVQKWIYMPFSFA